MKWSSEENRCLCDYLQWYSFHRSDLVCLSFSPLIWKLSNALTTSGHTPSQNLTLPHAQYLYAQYFGIISNFYVTCITSEREWDLLVKSKLTKLEEGNFLFLLSFPFCVFYRFFCFCLSVISFSCSFLYASLSFSLSLCHSINMMYCESKKVNKLN